MINDRIALLIHTLGLSVNSFSRSIEVDSTVIHNIIKGRRSKPSYDVLEKIFLQYRKLNVEWLLSGEGKIWKKRVSVLPANSSFSRTLEGRILQLINQLKEENQDSPELNELHTLVDFLIDENNTQRNKMIKLHERQEEIIDTLAKMKRVL